MTKLGIQILFLFGELFILKGSEIMKEKVLSVGIDIGTSTTEMVFSHIIIENIASNFRVPNIQIVDKEIIYRSPIYFTPLLSNAVLDTDGIMDIVKKEYDTAGIKPSDVQTGAVIITGDTARKENAENVLREISDYAGDFVVATAGPELESILAGKGSGASEFSRRNKGTILNLDIGGGTTNVALFENGEVLEASCFDIGGRLIRFSKETNEIEYIFPKIQKLFQAMGITVKAGGTLTDDMFDKITEVLAKGIIEIIDPSQRSFLIDFLATNEIVKDFVKIPDYVSLSGGVGDLVYQELLPKTNVFGDIGVLLAKKIRKNLAKGAVNVVKPAETIGATVVGAGNHSVNISGSTITVTAKSCLPIVNTPIMKVDNPINYTDEEIKKTFEKKINWIHGEDTSMNIALAIESEKMLTFDEIQLMARKIIIGMQPIIQKQEALIVVLKVDYGKVLGQSIQKYLSEDKQIICLDGVNVGNGDYIDIGRPVGVGEAVPVVIKTIAFSY